MHHASLDLKIELDNVELTDQGQILSLNISQISEGMVAAEDIIAKNQVLIIPKGQAIARTLLQGLKNFSTQVGVIKPMMVQIGQVGAATGPVFFHF